METITSEMAGQTIRSIGLILGNNNVYGPDHSVTRTAIDACSEGKSGTGISRKRLFEILEMLDLSADSAQKMKVLIEKVIEIAGVPDDDPVNKAIQASLYRKGED